MRTTTTRPRAAAPPSSLLRPGLPRTRRWGVGLAVVAACISGVAVFLNGHAVARFDDATVYTTAKNGVAALVLLGLLLAQVRRQHHHPVPALKPQTAGQWWTLALVALIGGSVPFVLFFEGLARASSTQAGFIHKTLVVWVALLAVPFLREKIGLPHLAAIVLLVWGQVVLAGDLAVFQLGAGELMVMAATLLWAVEFVVAKRLLGSLSSTTVGAGRLGIGLGMLLLLLAVTGRLGALGGYGWEQWGWVLLTGVVLAGFVGTWYAALARAQAVDVTAVLVFGAVITAGLAGAFDGAPLAPKALGLALIAAGAATVVVAAARRPRLDPAAT